MHQAFELSATRAHVRAICAAIDKSQCGMHRYLALGNAAIMIIKFVVQNQEPLPSSGEFGLDPVSTYFITYISKRTLGVSTVDLLARLGLTIEMLYETYPSAIQ